MRDDIAFVSQCSEAYLPHFLVLHDSIRRFHPNSRIFLARHGGQFSVPSDVETVAKYDGSPPAAIAKIRGGLMLESLRLSGQKTMFLDADIELFGPQLEAIEILDGHVLAAIPHTCCPLPNDGYAPNTGHTHTAGLCNAGFLLFRPGAEEALAWLDRSLEWCCVFNPPAGFVNEQTYISQMPAMFDGCLYWRTKQYNVAYWNFSIYNTRRNDLGEWITDGGPLRLMHYSGFIPSDPGRLSSGNWRPHVGKDLQIYFDYAAKLKAKGKR